MLLFRTEQVHAGGSQDCGNPLFASRFIFICKSEPVNFVNTFTLSSHKLHSNFSLTADKPDM